jgi:hypothetical protein
MESVCIVASRQGVLLPHWFVRFVGSLGLEPQALMLGRVVHFAMDKIGSVLLTTFAK